MMTKRIAHISLGTDVGGMEKLLVEFAKHIDRTRFELSFISLQKTGRLAEQIETYHWPVHSMNKSDGLKPLLVTKLARKLRRIRPDVVHTHNTAAYVYGVAAAKIAGISRIIHTRHGQRYDHSSRQTMLFRQLSRWVEHIVSVSQDGAKLTVQHDGVSAAKTLTICNGVDLQQFRMPEHRPHGKVVVVARLSPEKDIASLVQAMGLVNQQDPTLNLDIIGDGVERSNLQTLVGDLGLDRTVRFLGLRDDIPDLLASASMFVLPSITEGISLTLIEAMATGLPVIACDVGGNPEVVVNLQSGILVPAGRPQAIADAILHYHGQPEVANRYGIAGRQRVMQKFCVRQMMHAYENLYAKGAA
ncbi:glycosyltransferase [Stieleria sp. JC731]|uniref:glycosyltransferase n=1 Tax=Pirellulaceae TaxID=2691357 RepID=UPI001E3EB88D|nr:glycosyltransferase [Stieleria sp. JC731]MCC9599515.1 glycosyltransferase [Stieleria sp. JC731]